MTSASPWLTAQSVSVTCERSVHKKLQSAEMSQEARLLEMGSVEKKTDTCAPNLPSLALSIELGHRAAPSDPVDDSEWQLADIPRELRLVQPNTLPEVRRVIREVWAQCELVQESARNHASTKFINLQLQHNDSSEESLKTALEDPPPPTPCGSPARLQDNPETNNKPQRNNGRSESKESQEEMPEPPVGGNILSNTLSWFLGRKSVQSSTESSTQTKECASCFDAVPRTAAVDLGCQHVYCVDCFIQLILTSMQNETLWPPRCCLQSIPRETILRNLSKSQILLFGEKEREFSTVAKDRWYCTRPSCARWFAAVKYSSWTQCPHCRYKMCLHCRGEKHSNGTVCPQDKDLQATLAQAESEGWRVCYNCNALVELTTGCRHITCKCKAQFCYTCGARWKTCSCTEDDQQRRRQRLQEAREAMRVEREKVEREERELREALEAVAKAEREERERRLLEEKELAEAMEAERLEGIRLRYQRVTLSLAKTLTLQGKRIESRQAEALSCLEIAMADVDSRKQILDLTITEERESCERQLEDAQRRCIQEGEEAKSRHRRQQVALLSNLARIADGLDETALESRVQELLNQQELENGEREGQDRRRLDKLCARLARVLEGTDFIVRRVALQKDMKEAVRKMGKLERDRTTDRKWLEFAVERCDVLIIEDEQRLIRSGADAPEDEVGDPNTTAIAMTAVRTGACPRISRPAGAESSRMAAARSRIRSCRQPSERSDECRGSSPDLCACRTCGATRLAGCTCERRTRLVAPPRVGMRARFAGLVKAG